MRNTELLIPAGSLDVLKTAVVYGADAVYIGGEAFGLRAKAKNFTNEEIKEGINLGAAGYEDMNIMNDKVLVGSGFLEITKDNLKDYDF